MSQPAYRADCSCGWTFSMDKFSGNLPAENTREISETVVDAHQFAHDFAGEEFETSTVREVKA